MPPKVVCAFHSGQHITNFCMDKQCLLPLCPTCVKIHSVEHQMMQTIPHYEEVNQLVAAIGQNIRRNTVVIETDVQTALSVQQALLCSKMRALQSVDILRREMLAEIEIFCEETQKSITEAFRESEESIKQCTTILMRNEQATKTLLDCLQGQKPMRAIIKYLSKNVPQKVERIHREIQEMSQTPIATLLGVEIKSEPVKNLREFLQGLAKVSRKSDRFFETSLTNIYEELTSDRRRESSIESTTVKNSLATLNIATEGIVTPIARAQPRINREAYRSLPHHQIPPQKSPAAAIKHRISLLTSGLQEDSQHLVVKTIENDRPTELTATFHFDSNANCEQRVRQNDMTPKSYHMLGTRRPSSRNDNMQTVNSVNRSFRDSSEEKRIRTGLMLVQQRPQKGRRISFQRNIRMYNKENCNQSTIVEPFVE